MTEVVATNPAVSSLLETVVAYDGQMSLQSDSERTNATAGGERKRCICHIGDACQIMSTAFQTIQDPRGCFVVVPSYEVQLREAYCLHLRPNHSRTQNDPIEDFVVAVHHFHPADIDRCFNTDTEDRPEEDILPMPERTTVSSAKYPVMPSYSFDAAHGDLKQSMGHMPQLDLERCVRRMKREARRQKWEAVVDRWEAVSKRSTSNLSGATEALTLPPPSPSPSVSSFCTVPQSLDLPLLPTEVGNNNNSGTMRQMLEKDFARKLDKHMGGMGVSMDASMHTARPAEEESDQVKRGSIFTAQEVLESELGDDESIPDLNDEDSVPGVTSVTERESTGSSPRVQKQEAKQTATPPAPAARGHDDGSLSSLSNEGSSVEKRASKSSPQGLVVENSRAKKSAPVWTPPAIPKSWQPKSAASASTSTPSKDSAPKNDPLLGTKPSSIQKPGFTSASKSSSSKQKQESQSQSAPTTLWTPPAIPKSWEPNPAAAVKPESSSKKLSVPAKAESSATSPEKVDPLLGVPPAKAPLLLATPESSQSRRVEIPKPGFASASKPKSAQAPATSQATATQPALSEKPASKQVSFLKSRIGTALVIGVFCLQAVAVVMGVNHCTAVLKSREEAFA